MTDTDAIREKERKRIAAHMKSAAKAMICDPASDAIDGYAAAVVLDLADRIEKFQDA